MAASGYWDGATVPSNTPFSATRTASGTPTAESSDGSVFHLATATSAANTCYYTKTLDASTTYDEGWIEASLKRVSGSVMVCALGMKGRCYAQIDLVSDTSIRCYYHNGTTFVSNDYSVTSTTDAYHTYRIEFLYNSGSPSIKFYFDGTLKQTSTGAMDTVETSNYIIFGDNYGGATSDNYWDYVQSTVGPAVQTTKTVTADALIRDSSSTLTKMLVGDPGDTNVEIYGATASTHAYRLYDSGSVVQSAVADSNGKVSFTSTGLPITSGAIKGFTDNTYTTELSNRSYVGSVRVGNVFDTNPARLGTAGIGVVATDASYYYPTSQYGGRGQIVQTTNYWFVCYRTGGSHGESTGGVSIVRINRGTYASTGSIAQSIDQGPVEIRSGIYDGHENFSIAKGSTGKIRFVAGAYATDSGGSAGPLIMRETTSAYDITAWSSATTISGGGVLPSSLAQASLIYVTETDGTNHIAITNAAGGALYYGTATDAAPTTWTWKTIMSSSANWGALIGDLAVDESTSPSTVGIVWGMFKPTGSYAITDYRYCYFLKSTDKFATAKKESGSSVTLPVTITDATGVTTADQVASGNRYGFWHKVTFLNGNAYVLVDNDMASLPSGNVPGPQYVGKWNGSSWTLNAINDLPMWATNQTSPGSFPWNWNHGVLIGASNGTIYVYAVPTFDSTYDTTYQGGRLLRFRSTEASAFASYTTDTLMDDSYVPFRYAELNYTAFRLSGTEGAGFMYPKVPAEDPRTVVWSAVDDRQSSILLTSLSWYEKAFTADAKIVNQYTKTFTVDAIVKATSTKTFTADAVVTLQPLLTFTVDAVIKTAKTFTVDAVIVEPGVKTFTVDAVITGTSLVTRSATFSVDAVIQGFPNVVHPGFSVRSQVTHDLGVTSLVDTQVTFSTVESV